MVTGSETLLGATLTTSAVSVFIINVLKNSRWFPLLQKESRTAARVWALIVSGAAAAGIDVHFLQGTLTITGLTLGGILSALWMWLKSFAVQEWIYQSTKQQEKAEVDAGSSAVSAQSVAVADPAAKLTQAPKKGRDAVTRWAVQIRNVCYALALLGVAVAIMGLVGCAARVKTVTGLPANVTQSQVQEWDSAVANLQKISAGTSGARQAVIALNKSGVFPDGPAYAATLSDLGKIDQVQITAANFLQTVPNNWTGGVQQQMSGFISAIEAALTDLTTNGTIGIKDSKSEQSVTAFIQNIGVAANFILTLIQPAPTPGTAPAQKPVGGDPSAALVITPPETFWSGTVWQRLVQQARSAGAYRASVRRGRAWSNTPASSVLDGTVCRILGSGSGALCAS